MRSSRRFRWFVAGTACFVCVVGLAVVFLLSPSDASSVSLLSADEMATVYGVGTESETCGTSDAASQPCQPSQFNTSFVFECDNDRAICGSGTDKSGMTIKVEDTVDTSESKKAHEPKPDCTRPVTFNKSVNGPGYVEHNGACVEDDESTKYCYECTLQAGQWAKEDSFGCVDPQCVVLSGFRLEAEGDGLGVRVGGALNSYEHEAVEGVLPNRLVA